MSVATLTNYDTTTFTKAKQGVEVSNIGDTTHLACVWWMRFFYITSTLLLTTFACPAVLQHYPGQHPFHPQRSLHLHHH